TALMPSELPPASRKNPISLFGNPSLSGCLETCTHSLGESFDTYTASVVTRANFPSRSFCRSHTCFPTNPGWASCAAATEVIIIASIRKKRHESGPLKSELNDILMLLIIGTGSRWSRTQATVPGND